MNTTTKQTAEMQIKTKFLEILEILESESLKNCDPLQGRVSATMAQVATQALIAATAAAQVQHIVTVEEALTAMCEPLMALWDGQHLTIPAHWYAETREDVA